jgi:hypothetical protein
MSNPFILLPEPYGNPNWAQRFMTVAGSELNEGGGHTALYSRFANRPTPSRADRRRQPYKRPSNYSSANSGRLMRRAFA